MDITQHEAQDTAELQLRVNGGLSDIFIMFMGPDHPVRVAYERRMNTKDLRAVKKSGKMGAALPEDSDELFEQTTDRLVALTLGWRTRDEKHLVMGGERVPFTPEMAREIYANRKLFWIRRQAVEFLAEDENFLPSSLPASESA